MRNDELENQAPTEFGTGWKTQDNNSDAKVRVSGSYAKDDTERTDVIVIDKSTGLHDHRSYDGKTGEETIHHDSDRTG